MLVGQPLVTQELVEITFHKALDDVDVLHLIDGRGAHDLLNVDDVLVTESSENFDFAQRALTEALVFERGDLLDGHALLSAVVEGGDDHAVGAFADEFQVRVAWTDFEALLSNDFHVGPESDRLIGCGGRAKCAAGEHVGRAGRLVDLGTVHWYEGEKCLDGRRVREDEGVEQVLIRRRSRENGKGNDES